MTEFDSRRRTHFVYPLNWGVFSKLAKWLAVLRHFLSTVIVLQADKGPDGKNPLNWGVAQASARLKTDAVMTSCFSSREVTSRE